MDDASTIFDEAKANKEKLFTPKSKAIPRRNLASSTEV